MILIRPREGYLTKETNQDVCKTGPKTIHSFNAHYRKGNKKTGLVASIASG